MDDEPRPSTSGFVDPNRNRRRERSNNRSATRSNERSRSRRRRRYSRPSRRQERNTGESPRSRSLSKEQFQRIAKPTQAEVISAGDCSICLAELKVTQKNRKLSCNHVFHEDCLYRWVGGRVASCPFCRKELINEY